MLGLVLRYYNYEKSFSFAHDQDLYSWIAKDILINKHLRLVGQITSVDGVFIGPLYYYLIAFFYGISAMNPMSANFLTAIISSLTIYSFYLFGKKYFSDRIGLIMAFMYSISYGAAVFDHWSVPTEPTVLWSIWFLYLIFGALDGNIKLVPWYGILVGLTYHIHIALLPILGLPVLAYLLSEGRLIEKIRKLKLNHIIITIVLFFVVSSPFWLFEIKHNFSQIKSTLVAMEKDLGYPSGWPKFIKVVNASSREWQQRLLIGWESMRVEILWLMLILTAIIGIKRNKISKQQLLMTGLWLALIMGAQYGSKRQVSEYYFTNLVPVFILVLALSFDLIKTKILFGIAAIYLIINFYWMFELSDVDHSYYYRRQLVLEIKKDAEYNKYPCVALNFISDFGSGVGFRYLSWHEGLLEVKPSNKVPIYNIVIPWQTSADEINSKHGRFGLIKPKPSNDYDPEYCIDEASLPDPLLGYTD